MILRYYNAFKAYDPETHTVDFNASLSDDSTYHSLNLDFFASRILS